MTLKMWLYQASMYKYLRKVDIINHKGRVWQSLKQLSTEKNVKRSNIQVSFCAQYRNICIVDFCSRYNLLHKWKHQFTQVNQSSSIFLSVLFHAPCASFLFAFPINIYRKNKNETKQKKPQLRAEGLSIWFPQQ